MSKSWKSFVILSLFFFLIGANAWLTARYTCERKEAEEAYSQMRGAITERDNAKELARQWEKMCREAVLEIAALKGDNERLTAENEELNAQIDVLRKPPDGIYDAEFGYDYDYVVRVVGAEARGEPFAGILAVAQCIADTAERTGMTPEQVVKSGRYSSPVNRSCTDNMETVNEACLMIFAEGMRPFDEPIEYFYAFKNGKSSWHESQIFCYEIGGHRYFKRAGA